MTAHICSKMSVLIAEIESWKRKYKTFQQPYSRDLIEELLDKAGMNIKNNKENLLQRLRKSFKGKHHIIDLIVDSQV